MPEKDTLYQTKVKHSGIFDFPELYKFCFEWFNDEGYDILEKKYSEKIKGDLKEIEVDWECFRKVSDYFKFLIKVRFYIPNMADVEAQKNGQKVSANKGSLDVKLTAVMIKDYEKRWEGNAFLKFLRGVYDRYIIRGRIEQYEAKIIGEITDLIAEIKAFLSIGNK
ncbi:MAG: hypothetical protein KKF56_03135 [Nanoarchaeota archaeon]|nr:hypothetical protein [Nanoarchaeota archaeon]